MNVKAWPALGLVAVLCSACASAGSVTPTSTRVGSTSAHADFRTFPTLAELAKESSLGAVVTFLDSRSQVHPDGYPMTYFTARIERVLHQGTTTLSAGDLITIAQTGGTVEGRRVEAEEDPLFVVGERDVLFLSRRTTGRYAVVGGPGGRFDVDSSSTVVPVRDNPIRFTGTVDDLMRALAAI